MDKEKAQAFVDELNALVKKYGLMLYADGMPQLTLAPFANYFDGVTIYEDHKNDCYCLDPRYKV